MKGVWGRLQRFDDTSMPSLEKPRLIALDHDVYTLREVASMLSPWFNVLRMRDPMRAMAAIGTDRSISARNAPSVLMGDSEMIEDEAMHVDGVQ